MGREVWVVCRQWGRDLEGVGPCCPDTGIWARGWGLGGQVGAWCRGASVHRMDISHARSLAWPHLSPPPGLELGQAQVHS